MGQDSNSLVAAIENGLVLTAPMTADPPTDSSGEWGADWTELGYVDESPGIELVMAGDNTDIRAWTILDALRTLEGVRTVTINFGLRQFDRPTVEFAWDAQVTTVRDGEFQIDLPNRRNVQRQLAFEWDDEFHYRFVFFKGRVVENRNTTFPDTTTLVLPVGYRAQRKDKDTPLGSMFTDDPAFLPVVTS